MISSIEKTSEKDPNRRKPSYVGLSCTVSGYSSFNRYNDERKTTPPAAIPVPSDPQTLDVVVMRQDQVRGNGNRVHSVDDTDNSNYFSPNASKFVHHHQSVETKFYSMKNHRETSPASDCGSSSSSTASSSNSSSNSPSSGNLVQKQIERLYGGKIHSIHSPPSPSTTTTTSSSLLSSTSRSKERFNSKKKEDHPLDVKTLKIPAVFRFLRPEFREQLKTHSCTVDIPLEGSSLSSSSSSIMKNKKERIIPITRTNETLLDKKPEARVIPIQRTTTISSNELKSPIKPALPAKPLSPRKEEEEEVLKVEEIVEEQNVVIQDNNDEIYEDDDDDDDNEIIRPPVGGLRERELLCTILEEDNESTASGCSLPRTNGMPHSASVINNTLKKDDNDEETISILPEKDGNYFIKLIENEVFKFEEQICDFEEDLCNNESLMNEEVRECILAAIGKAKLLMSQKLAQFRGLCDKNISSNIEEDPFVPTNDDLAGFWDMVYIQVEHIHSLFAELIEIRKNGWTRPQKEPKEKPKNGSMTKTRTTKKKVIKPTSQISQARDEARRKMLEEKKKQMAKQKQQNSDNGVQMFV